MGQYEAVQRPERRRFERFQMASAALKCAKAGLIALLNKPFPAELVNLSASGLRLKTHSALKAGERVAGKIVVEENRDTVDVAGTIVWAAVIPPEYRTEQPVTVAGLRFDSDVSRQAKLESMRKWFGSNRYKTTRRIVAP